MLINPQAQQKAFEEIQRVTGTHRLPTFEDRESLPYVECVYKETLRWASVSPLSRFMRSANFPLRITDFTCVITAVPPHRLVTDDIYRDFHLPKGSNVRCSDDCYYDDKN